jgi:RHS repeat-associated protein
MKLLKSATTALLLALATLVCAAPAAAQTVEYVHTDALGSVVAVTDANRNIVERREYEPYGYQLTPTLQNGPGYTGHVQDASTGLTYMQQRYYDPLLGRFLSVDPVTMHDTGDARHFNRYGYANNNPYTYNDPDGRWAESAVDAALISYDVSDIATNGLNWVNGTSLVANVVGLAVPIGTGFGLGTRALMSGDDAVKATLTAEKAAEVPGRADFIVSSNGTAIHNSPDAVRNSLEGAGFSGQAITNKAGTETGTLHNVPDMKMDIRVMDGGPAHPPRVVTNQQGTSSMVDSATGRPFRNDVPKPERIERSHIRFE